MKKHITSSLGLVVLAVFSFVSSTFATVTIDWVTVGNPGNAADTVKMNDGTTGYGAVGYQYNIGKNDVTVAQYAEFLNAKAASDPYSLWNTDMSTYGGLSCGITRNGSSGSYTYSVTSGLENRPVVWVTWFDAAAASQWRLEKPKNPEGCQKRPKTRGFWEREPSKKPQIVVLEKCRRR